MSKGYYKTCGRKVAAPPPSQSIQFDTLFCENSNKPSAAKSAGTLGKWGITSFTSIRSSSFTVGNSRKSEPVTYKRSRYESKSNDAYSFSPPSPTAAVSPVQPKPKKFFKSRNAESEKPGIPSATVPPATKKPIKSSKAAFKRNSPVSNFEDPEPEPYVPSTKETKETKEAEPSNSHNPPIVLRIFKGTAQLLTEDAYIPKREKEKEKESRRRATHDSDEEYIPPKKHRHRTKDTEKPTEPVSVIDKELESLRNDLEGNTDEEIKKPNKEEEPISRRTRSEDKEKPSKAEELEPILETVNEPQQPHQEVAEEIPRESEELIENISHVIQETSSVVEDHPLVLEEEEKLTDSGIYTNDDKVDEILDLRYIVKQDSIEYADEEQDDGPLDLHVPHASEKQVLPVQTFTHIPENEPSEDHPQPKVEMESSDSDYSEPQDRPSVVQSIKNEPVVPKLTLRPKKGSIFKSRVGEKRNAHYIHKWCDKEEVNKQNPCNASLTQSKVIEGEFSENLTRITNYTKPDEFSEESEMFTSVTCSKTAKEFYTVVRNVKKAHQIQESGEFQEFNDDVEYILDALQDNNPIGTRCLSAITLASKCMVPAFRMHVRAHGTVQKFFKALHDASKDQSLGMCTATVMFVLSQDRLNMDLDRESLELMLSLLESDASSQALDDCGFTHAQLAKTKDRVRSLCQEIKEQGHANHLNLDNITVGQLAMETLLSLTSKRAGEWFKEELRDLGGLEHIVRTIVETAACIDPSIVMWDAPLLERMRKLDRCLRVLENVTLNNEDNSNYLLAYGDGELVDTVLRVFMTCGSQILLYPVTSVKDKLSVGAVLRDCLVATLKILINITHDFNNKSSGSSLAGKKPGLIDSSLHVLFIVPDYVPEEQKFDLTFMSLMLLINLVEHSEANRQLLIEAQAPKHPELLFENSRPAISALITLFTQQEELARNVERKTDAILDGEDKPAEQTKSHEEYIEETVALLLQKAGRHMEYTFVAAYIATLLGYIVMDNEDHQLVVRNHLPNHNFGKLVEVLQKFFNFMNLTASSGSASTRGIKATEMLIKHLTSIDQKVKEEAAEPPDEHKLFY